MQRIIAQFFLLCALFSCIAATSSYVVVKTLLRQDGEESPAQAILEMFDTNSDGLLSMREFTEIFHTLYKEEDEHDHSHSHGGDEEEEVLQPKTVDHGHGDDHEELVCHSIEEIYEIYDTNLDSQLDANELQNASAPMLYNIFIKCTYMVLGDSCTRTSTAVTWISGIVASVIVSVISLVGVALIPFGKPNWDKWLLSPLVAFAVGALLGDTLFHLVPAILDVHSHSAHGEDEEDSLGEKGYLLPTGLALLTALIFFILERQIHHLHHHHHTRVTPKKDKGYSFRTEKDATEMAAAEEYCDSSSDEDCSHADAKKDPNPSDEKQVEKMKITDGPKKVEAFGWLSLLGDSLHNFTDGLAIGAAFSSSFSSGVATTIAVICHEIPQELGDFAILIRAGFTKVKALMFNLFSSLTAVMGVIIGLAIGTNVEGATKYILSFTVGAFLYVSLANMAPELQKEKGWKNTLIQASCIFLGFLIMLFIALWLEDISFC